MADPWMRFYPSDWLASTRGLTPTETGLYILLITAMVDREGPLFDDERDLARFVGARPSVYRKALQALLDGGEVVKTASGLWCPIIDKWGARASGRETIPKSLRDAVYARDGKACVYCGCSDGPFHLDHVFPVSAGGQNDLDNLVVACRPCNLSKGAKTLEEWMQ